MGKKKTPPMSSQDIMGKLEDLASADDVVAVSYDLTDAWTAAGVGAESIEPILRFIEANPNLDYGAPGPLVHFMETFYRNGLEEKVVESVTRTPVGTNVFMLNRLINDATGKRRDTLLATMKQAGRNSKAKKEVRELINEFVEYQESEG